MCMEVVIIRALLSHVAEINNIFPIFPLLVSSNYFVSSIEQLKKDSYHLFYTVVNVYIHYFLIATLVYEFGSYHHHQYSLHSCKDN